MTLYEIDEQIKNCILIDEETGECVVDESRLADLQLERDAKLENIALYIKNLKAEEPAIDAEIKRLQTMKKTNTNRIESLKGYLQESLKGQKFKTVRASVSFRSSASVLITDSKKIPEKYFKYQEPAVSKADILKALKNGEEVAGATLTYNMSTIIK